MAKYEVGDTVYIVDRMKAWETTTKWDHKLQKRIPIFPWKTNLENTYTIHDRHNGKKLQVIESMNRPKKENQIIYLCKDDKMFDYVVVLEEGLCNKPYEEYLKDKKQKLINANLKKWHIDQNLKEFPKELLEVYYDTDQKVLFGSHYTKGVVTYGIIPAEYTVDGIALYAYSGVDYNGKGCSLENKKTIDWEGLKKLCKNNTFIG